MIHVRLQWLELTMDKNALKRVINLQNYKTNNNKLFAYILV